MLEGVPIHDSLGKKKKERNSSDRVYVWNILAPKCDKIYDTDIETQENNTHANYLQFSFRGVYNLYSTYSEYMIFFTFDK